MTTIGEMIMNEVLQKILDIYKKEVETAMVGDVVEGELDSLEIMKLVVAIEDEFDIEFDIDELDTEVFTNPQNVYELVRSKI